MEKKFLLLMHSLLLLIPLAIKSQETWNLKLDKEGIKIYDRPYAGSRIRGLKVTCVLEASLSQMVAVLLDIKSQDEWFYHTHSITLKNISASELYYYAELEFPFPFRNRDFIERIRINQDTMTKTVMMDVENLPDYIPAKSYIVRVRNSSCKWVIMPVGAHIISVEFTLFADPGGSIPVWIVNMFSMYGPFETFKKLKYQLKKSCYKNARFSFIRD